MNRDIVEGNWKQFKGTAQAGWSRLIGDSIGVISGRRTQSVGARQRAFGVIRAKTLRDAKGTRYPARSISLVLTAVADLSKAAPATSTHEHS